VKTVSRVKVGTFDVEVWEEGTGPPLVFLHGYERHPGGAAFLARLAEHRHVWAPEQPGYGTSLGFDQVDDLMDLVLFYRELVMSFEAGAVDVIGHSTGGMIAAELSVIAPALVRRLVLVDPFGLWIDDDPAQDPFGARDVVLAAKWHDPALRPIPEPTNFVPDSDEPFAASLFQARNYATATKFMWPIAERGLRRRLQYLRAPTLVVHGAADGLLPVSYAREMVRLIPDARLELIEQAGHYPMLEQEDAFVATVEAFLEEG
jgi:pimeloyl-ACP methyl ester carboxylesterase